MKGKLKLHEPVKVQIKDWPSGTKAVILSPYYLCAGEKVRYRTVDETGYTDTLDEDAIVSVSECGLNEKMKAALIALSTSYAKERDEDKRYRDVKKGIAKTIKEAELVLNA